MKVVARHSTWVICGFLTMLPVHGYIYIKTILHKHDAQTGQDTWFIGLGDYHCKQHPITPYHAEKVKRLVAMMHPEKAHLLVEDLSSKNSDDRNSCGHFVVNSSGGVLGQLTQIAQDHGVSVQNLEYRYARVCALGPVLNNPHADPYRFPSVRTITVQDMHTEVLEELARVSLYSDCPLLNRWYAQGMRQVKKRLSQLQWQPMITWSAADLMQCKSAPQRLALIDKFLTFDSDLLDIKIVHAVVDNPRAQTICAIAGGSHIKRAAAMLKKIGYRVVAHDEGTVHEAACAAQAIASEGIAMPQHVPRPVSLKKLKHYF